MESFQKKYDFDKRLDESKRIKAKYPNKLPVIVEKNKKSKMEQIEKSKFLVPEELTVAQLLTIIRKRINLNKMEAIYILTGDKLPATSQTIASLYSEHKNKDGFLYITYCNENVFGTLH